MEVPTDWSRVSRMPVLSATRSMAAVASSDRLPKVCSNCELAALTLAAASRADLPKSMMALAENAAATVVPSLPRVLERLLRLVVELLTP